MDEYIERETLEKELNERLKALSAENGGWYDLYTEGFDECVNRVEDFPASNVAPVVHGRWEWREKWDVDIPNHNTTLEYCGWYCSHCGIELGEYMTKNTNEKHYYDDDFCKPTLNHCPNCGARMDLEAEP